MQRIGVCPHMLGARAVWGDAGALGRPGRESRRHVEAGIALLVFQVRSTKAGT